MRITCVRVDAMPGTTTIRQTGAGRAALAGIDPSQLQVGQPGALGRALTGQRTAQSVAFLLSPAASGVASQVVTVSDRRRCPRGR